MMFQENLRRYREKAGLTAKEFAAMIGVKYTTYAGYETQGREPKYETLCKIADTLHVTTDELLGYEIDVLAKCKKFVQDAGLKICETSPPGCVSVLLEWAEINEKFRLFPPAPEGLENVPTAFSNEDFIEWVSFAMEDFAEDMEPTRKAAAKKSLYITLIADIMSKLPEEERRKVIINPPGIERSTDHK